MSAHKIKELLGRSKDYDNDVRFMAVSDLTVECAAMTNIADPLQVEIRDAMIERIRDTPYKNSTVKTAAIKWLNTCQNKLSPAHIMHIAEHLAKALVDKQAAGFDSKNEDDDAQWQASMRDMADALTTLLGSVSEQNGKAIAPSVARFLIQGLNRKPGKDKELEMVCLDLTKTLIESFGRDINGNDDPDSDRITMSDKLLRAVQSQLAHPNEDVRERASVTVGPLVLILKESSFKSLMKYVVEGLKGTDAHIGLYINTLTAISQSAGLRVAPFMDQFLPTLLELVDNSRESVNEGDRSRLLEAVLLGLEALLRNLPMKMTPYIDKLVPSALAYISYDPQYMGEPMDTGESDAWAGGDDGWGDEEDGFEDEEMTSAGDWDKGVAVDSATVAATDESDRVRTASLKLLSTFFKVRQDLVKAYYNSVMSQLILRFTERIPSVKEAVLIATRDLIREGISGVAFTTMENGKFSDSFSVGKPLALTRQTSLVAKIDQDVDNIVGGLEPQYKNADGKTTKAIFGVLAELTLVRQGGMSHHFPSLVPHIQQGLKDESAAAVVPDALHLLTVIIRYHAYDQLKEQIPALSEGLLHVINKGDSKTIPGALHAASALIVKIKGFDAEQKELVQDLFSAINHRLQVQDCAEAVKLSSIKAMGTLLSAFGPAVSQHTNQVLKTFDARLRNETMRVAALDALIMIADSDVKCDMSETIKLSLNEICTFLRKSNAELRYATANCLQSLIHTHAQACTKAQYETIFTEVGARLNDEDLPTAGMCLRLLVSALRADMARTHQYIGQKLLPLAIQLVCSPLMQGQALEALSSFFSQCVQVPKNKDLSYTNLAASLLQCVTLQMPKDNVRAVAYCIAAMTTKIDDATVDKTVKAFVGDLKSGDVYTREVALLSLGEIGRLRDLSSHRGLDASVYRCFRDSDISNSASFAYGGVCAGNLQFYLPILLKELEKEERLYLLLCSLNEIVKASATSAKIKEELKPKMSAFTPILTQYVEHKDLGVRDIVAETFGRLASQEPDTYLPQLAKMARGTSPFGRQTAVTAWRFSFQNQSEWEVVGRYIADFLSVFSAPFPTVNRTDPNWLEPIKVELEIKRQAAMSCESLMRANIELFTREVLEASILPGLYAETKQREELIEEKDYVAVKEMVDHALPLRKSVYTALSTLAGLIPKRLNLQEFLSQTKYGLVDGESDIQILTFELWGEMCRISPESVLEELNTLPQVLMARIKALLKQGRQDDSGSSSGPAKAAAQSARDVLRAFVSASIVFNEVPGVEQCVNWTKFYAQIVATKLLKPMLEEILREQGKK
eukprot:gb/GEZN01000435.1/.p1 GENE.gb/GEZN01000435.1/~~gb/GEZN01000435.1/.p1  ORF type:complete len:1306 (+),score=196.27 gb/GEZN01000435.1/:54-3971(+)